MPATTVTRKAALRIKNKNRNAIQLSDQELREAVYQACIEMGHNIPMRDIIVSSNWPENHPDAIRFTMGQDHTVVPMATTTAQA